jgi:hypothetical protein
VPTSLSKADKPKELRDLDRISGTSNISASTGKDTVAPKSKIDLLNKEVVSTLSLTTTGFSAVSGKDSKTSTKQKHIDDDDGLYYFDHTAAGIYLAEVIHQKRSELLGRADSRVVYYRKSKAFVIEDEQIFKVTLKDLKKARFGVDLSRVRLDSLKHYSTVVVLSIDVFT